MKKLNVLTRMLLLVALLVGSTSVWATEVYEEITAEQFGFSSNTNLTGDYETLSATYFDLTFAQNDATTPCVYNSKSKHFRLYKHNNGKTIGGSIEISAKSSDIKITKIEFTFDNLPTNYVFTPAGSFNASTKTWTGESSSVKLTDIDDSGQIQLKSFKVYYKNLVTSFSFAETSQSVTLSKDGDDYVASNTQIVSFTPVGYNGTISYSIDEENSTIGSNTTAEVSSAGVVSVLASANEESTIIVKAIGTSSDTYLAPATVATYTLTVHKILDYVITAQANNDTYGSVDVEGTTIIATANSGYKVPSTGGYTVTEGDATVVNNGDGTFSVSATEDCTVQINFIEKATPNFSFSAASASATYGGAVTPPALINDDSTGEVTYESSNSKVATIDNKTGEINTISVGTTIITATIAEDDDYKTAQASYTLTVNEDAAASGASNNEILFYESFDKCDGTGGNSGGNSGSVAGSEITTYISGTTYTDNEGWNSDKVYKGDGCIKLGTGSVDGSITTPGIAFDSEKTYTLTFQGLQWSSDGTAITVSISGEGSVSGVNSPALGSSDFKECKYTINGASSGDKITINRNKRFFLDEVKVSATYDFSFVNVTVPSSGWGTYCSPYPLDFSNAATEVTAYAVSSYDADARTVTFKKITSKVPAKTPIVINGKTGSKKIAVAEGVTSAPNENLLRGYLSPTYYAGADGSETLMGLSGGTFKKMNPGTIPANKAVLVMKTEHFNSMQDDPSKMTFIFVDDATETDGISNHNVNFVKYDGNAYNLAGQRVGSDYKGVVIVNGKKVVRK